MIINDADPAAVWYLTLGMRDAFATDDKWVDIFEGQDNMVRSLLPIAEAFEKWACTNINFENNDEVWCYWLEETIGPALVTTLTAARAQFERFVGRDVAQEMIDTESLSVNEAIFEAVVRTLKPELLDHAKN